MSNYLPDGCTDEMCYSAQDVSEIQEDPDNVKAAEQTDLLDDKTPMLDEQRRIANV